jgi:archaellum biogenesis ATPase FlaH
MDADCEKINNGLLKKGLRTTVISITMKCQEFLAKFDSAEINRG